MAGIAGIILKNQDKGNKKYEFALHSMLEKLSYNDDQLKNTSFGRNCYMGNIMPISSKKNDHYIKSKDLPYHIVVDGLVFIDKKEKEILNKHYSINDYFAADYFYIPYLYDYYKNDFLHHITGWYNIFLYDENTHKSLLMNDRLGYLPLYYYSNDHLFLFASKIESILASGLMSEIGIDKVTIAEHLLFNYPLSDYTYINNIYTLPQAVYLNPGEEKSNFKKYWDIEDFFNYSPISKKQSVHLIDEALNKSLRKFMDFTNKDINFSLTGGWDSRVVLSFMLPDYKDKIKTYSFGAPDADDITIPSHIASQEGFEYSSFKLDDSYLENRFMVNAKDTILLSNGTRNYKRTHYVYAIKKVGKKSEYLLTGIFGDEVFKVGRPQGGTVISKNAVDLIDLNFDVEKLLNKMELCKISKHVDIQQEILRERLKERLNPVCTSFKKYETMGEKYSAFRFTLNLRKYFGNEVNSYNDFVFCYSPFIDHDFLKEFAKTSYMVSRFGFESPSFKLKAQSSWLYYKLTSNNNPVLTKYNSSRGFSMKATQSFVGMLRIILSKTLLRKFQKKKDGFNTNNTDVLFREYIENEKDNSTFININKTNSSNHQNASDLLSLKYYLNYLDKKYKITN